MSTEIKKYILGAMSKLPYTSRQIEAQNLLQSVSGEGVSSNIIDEIIRTIGEAEQSSNGSAVVKQEDTESLLKQRLSDVPADDWRKRASIAAMIISSKIDY